MKNSTETVECEATVDLDATFLSDDLKENSFTVKEGTITFPMKELGVYNGVVNFTIRGSSNISN